MNKITIFFEFLIREIPKELNGPISNFFSNQVSSLIHTEKEEYIFIIYIQIVNEIPKLKIKYISDDLRRKLRYSRSDFSKIDFSFSKRSSVEVIYSLKVCWTVNVEKSS